MDKNIKDFSFLYLKNDYFEICKKEQRLRNDIILVIYNNGNIECRMYMNSGHKYVRMPYNINMLEEVSRKTWTVDNIGRGTGLFVKSGKESLKKVFHKYGYTKSDYSILDIKKDGIGVRNYFRKRKEYIKKNPLANSEYA